mmetsp:Transcript_46715/g.110189  ORF Transcript_46715/g.110189 Transcript_46715/m.110189 type:complete len:81 (+) Transcript_46715:353-595(+)
MGNRLAVLDATEGKRLAVLGSAKGLKLTVLDTGAAEVSPLSDLSSGRRAVVSPEHSRTSICMQYIDEVRWSRMAWEKAQG